MSKELEKLNIEFKNFVKERCGFDELTACYHFPTFLDHLYYSEKFRELLKKIIISKNHELKLNKSKIILIINLNN